MEELTEEMIRDDKLHREFEALGMTRVHSSYDAPLILSLHDMSYLGYSYHWGDYRDNPPRVDMITYNPLIFRLGKKECTPDELIAYAKSPQGKKELYPLSRLKRQLDWEIWKYFYENYNRDIEKSEDFKLFKDRLGKEIDKL